MTCKKGDTVTLTIKNDYDFENAVLAVRYRTSGIEYIQGKMVGVNVVNGSVDAFSYLAPFAKEYSGAGVVVNNEATLVALGDITSGSALLALIGLIITGFMYTRNIPGAILIGILVTMVIGIFMGVTEFKGVVSMPESVAPIFCKFEFDKILSLDMLVVVFTFLFIDMFDTVGTLVGVCTKAKMVDDKGNIQKFTEGAFRFSGIRHAAMEEEKILEITGI